jgi:hypothetical protein
MGVYSFMGKKPFILQIFQNALRQQKRKVVMLCKNIL